MAIINKIEFIGEPVEKTGAGSGLVNFSGGINGMLSNSPGVTPGLDITSAIENSASAPDLNGTLRMDTKVTLEYNDELPGVVVAEVESTLTAVTAITAAGVGSRAWTVGGNLKFISPINQQVQSIQSAVPASMAIGEVRVIKYRVTYTATA